MGRNRRGLDLTSTTKFAGESWGTNYSTRGRPEELLYARFWEAHDTFKAIISRKYVYDHAGLDLGRFSIDSIAKELKVSAETQVDQDFFSKVAKTIILDPLFRLKGVD